MRPSSTLNHSLKTLRGVDDPGRRDEHGHPQCHLLLFVHQRYPRRHHHRQVEIREPAHAVVRRRARRRSGRRGRAAGRGAGGSNLPAGAGDPFSARPQPGLGERHRVVVRRDGVEVALRHRDELVARERAARPPAPRDRAVTETTQLIHEVLFDITPGQRLSAMVELNPIRTVVVPTLGGLLLGLLGIVAVYYRPRRAVDPIEANALYGGRMSMNDSLIVVLQTVLSNGVGASVGLEAGYTQAGSALASRFGRMFRVRRNDLRLLVGCGSAAAIAGAFNAPLTGAFYAFELVIGTYSIGTFAPVAVAAIVSVAVVQALGGAPFDLVLQVPSRLDALDYIPILALGMLCALVGITIMRGVTLTEELFRKSRVPGWLRPVCGELAVGLLALLTPAVLSSGHGALAIVIEAPYSLSHVALLVVLKSLSPARLDRLGLASRSLLATAVPGSTGRQAVRRHACRGQHCPRGVRRGLCTGRHERPGGGYHRRAVDHGLPRRREHRQPAAHRGRAGRLRHLCADRPPNLRVFFRHLAFPPARRVDPQRSRYRLDAQPHGGPHDASRDAHGACRYTHRGFQARLPPRRPSARPGTGRRGPAMRGLCSQQRYMPMPMRTTRCANCCTTRTQCCCHR